MHERACREVAGALRVRAAIGQGRAVINWLHSLLHRPESGWDPVPDAHADRYARTEWLSVDSALIDRLAQRLGGFEGRRILDLGGGPGQFAAAFAARGANVTWHDVSSRYLRIASDHAARLGLDIEFSLGYLEDARRLVDHPFDLVFCRIAWSYCRSDAPFARLVYDLVVPGGFGYVDTNTPAFVEDMSTRLRLTHWLNDRFSIKIGHPYPPRGRLAELFCRLPMERMEIDHSVATNDRILFQKARSAGR
jgi:SAM-dependent methyltransferase